MDYVLIHTVIHGFSKNSKTSTYEEVVKKEVTLDNSLPAVKSLVSGVGKLIGKSGNNPSWGQFGEEQREGKFPTSFRNFAENKDNEDVFLSLSHTAVDELVMQACEEPLSTGGHILVSLYKLAEIHYLLIAMIKQRGAVSLDKNYIPYEVTEMDLSKIHQAARINIQQFLKTPAISNEDIDHIEDKSYLCFIGQNADKQASGYFVKALGCTKGLPSSRATSNVFNGVDRFFKKNPKLKPYRGKARDKLTHYLTSQLEKGRQATLDEIIHVINSGFPVDYIGDIKDLKEYLSSEDIQVPESFSIHSATLKNKTRIKTDTGSWALNFEKGALGSNENSTIFYRKDTGTITIKELPEQLKKDIEKELSTRTLE